MMSSSRTVVFSADILDALSPHAAKRNIHVNELARLIVEQVLDDDIVDAVVDDAGAVYDSSSIAGSAA